MNLIVDTREHKGKNEHVTDYFDNNNIHYVRSKLFCGDYTQVTNQSICIDRKANINEIAQNVCQEHQRTINEIRRAKENGIELIYLIESDEIETLENLPAWLNPRRFTSSKAVNGSTLYKILKTISDRYGTKFLFTTKEQCGAKIVELLGGQ